jgi:hypothetical protein
VRAPNFARKDGCGVIVQNEILLSAVTEPELFDVTVGHAGDVVSYRAGEAFGGDLELVVGGQKVRVTHDGREELPDHRGGALVLFFHSW